MSDPFPVGWPTAEQRARVEARVRSLRARRRAIGTAAAALVIVLAGGGIVALRGSGGGGVTVAAEATSTTTHPAPSPAIVSAPEPKGWRLVDFGDARLAFPPGWSAAPPTGTSPAPCATAPGGVVVLYQSAPSCPTVTLRRVRTVDSSSRAFRTVHGIPVYTGFGNPLFVQYLVPVLGVEIDFHREPANPVLGTLTSSARRVVLGGGARPAVPSDWKPLTFGGVSLRVPPSMPVTRLAAHTLAPGECSAVPFPRSGAFLGNGVSGALPCPMIPAGVVGVPTDGVWMHTDDGPSFETFLKKIFVGRLGIGITDALVSEAQGLHAALDLTIFSYEGKRSSTVVRVGLGADPEIARTILYSIRPAGPSN